MSLALPPPPVPLLRVDSGGVVRVGGTRVTLDSVVFCYQQGDSPERIVEQYPAISLAEAYGAVAYYLGHRAEVDAYLAEERRRADEMRRKIESTQDHTGMRERLLARKRAEQGMLALLADEDFNDDLCSAVLGLVPDADILRVQEIHLRETPDSEILAWAAENARIVLSHDANTMTAAAYERVAEGLSMSGLVIVPRDASRSTVVQDIAIILACGVPEEFVGQVVFLPFK